MPLNAQHRSIITAQALPDDKRAPNFFIVGAMRGGTTAIANALLQHPQVFLCPIKEPGFFATDITMSDYGNWHRKNLLDPAVYVASGMADRRHLAYVHDPEVYSSLFAAAAGYPAIGEASTAYLFSAAAAAAIAAACPNARIVISLRNPYERAISEFLMNKSIGTATGTFSDALRRERQTLASGAFPYEERYVFASLYAKQIARYLSNFPRENILILRHEELATNSTDVLRKIYAHIGVDPAQGTATILNPNPRKGPRFPATNKFLYRTGLKQAVSDWTPKLVKDRFAPLFYTDDTDIEITDADWNYLKTQFEPDLTDLIKLLGPDFRPWSRAT